MAGLDSAVAGISGATVDTSTNTVTFKSGGTLSASQTNDLNNIISPYGTISASGSTTVDLSGDSQLIHQGSSTGTLNIITAGTTDNTVSLSVGASGLSQKIADATIPAGVSLGADSHVGETLTNVTVHGGGGDLLSTAFYGSATVSGSGSNTITSASTSVFVNPTNEQQYTGAKAYDLSTLHFSGKTVDLTLATIGKVKLPNAPISGDTGSTVVTGITHSADSLVGANDIMLDATGTSNNPIVFAINLAGVTNTVALKGVSGAILAGDGTVRIDDNNSVFITSDIGAQNITGGGGNDTLVGAGNDTLTGGAGADVFGFQAKGHYVITDFNKASDTLAFNFSNLHTLSDLAAKVTSVVTTATDITYNFGPDSSITLVGVSATDITAGMIKFQIS
ncbi:MAG TPA: hypothetical protein VMH83_12750 [Candidatus Acidoferrum sp.]|nr:hypothetical protein [Candidatus Acidoferrum sp.]